MPFKTNQKTHVSLYLLNSIYGNISFTFYYRCLLWGSPNIEKSHFSPVDISPSWPKSCWRREKRNDWISRKMVSLFVPLVIQTHILLIKMKWFSVLFAKTVLPPPPQSPSHLCQWQMGSEETSTEQPLRACAKICSRGTQREGALFSSSCSRNSLTRWLTTALCHLKLTHHNLYFPHS